LVSFHVYRMYSQTCVNGHLQIITTFQ
jgi:hypothetical protein